MNRLLAILRVFFARDEAATMVEYGMVLILVAVVCVATVSYIGSNEVNSMFKSIIPAF